MFAFKTSSRCAGVSDRNQRTSDSSWSSALGGAAASFAAVGWGESWGTRTSLSSTLS